jgi:hypothetical protein
LGKLIYSMITSLDGFVSDPAGNFGWGAPEQESHEFINGVIYLRYGVKDDGPRA